MTQAGKDTKSDSKTGEGESGNSELGNSELGNSKLVPVKLKLAGSLPGNLSCIADTSKGYTP